MLWGCGRERRGEGASLPYVKLYVIPIHRSADSIAKNKRILHHSGAAGGKQEDAGKHSELERWNQKCMGLGSCSSNYAILW